MWLKIFGTTILGIIVASVLGVLFLGTDTFIHRKIPDTRLTSFEGENEIPHTNIESDGTKNTISDTTTQQKKKYFIPGVLVDDTDAHLGIQNLRFGTETECMYVIDDVVLRTIVGLGIHSPKIVDVLKDSVIEKTSWYTAISEIGNWYSCGKKLTLSFDEGDGTSVDYEALTNDGWNRQLSQDLQIGTYIVPLTMMVSGGASGSTDIFMRTSTGATPTVQFLVVNQRLLRLYEEDGVRTCPCREEYIIFLSESYPYGNLLPLVEDFANKTLE